MRGKTLNLLKIIFAVLLGAGITYLIIANPFSKGDNSDLPTVGDHCQRGLNGANR